MLVVVIGEEEGGGVGQGVEVVLVVVLVTVAVLITVVGTEGVGLGHEGPEDTNCAVCHSFCLSVGVFLSVTHTLTS